MVGKLKKIGIAIIIIAVLGFSYAYYEARNLKLVHYTFTHRDIPEAFDGTKIIFVSDIHCNTYFSPDKVGELVSRINDQKPDIVVLGGDNTDKDSLISIPFFNEIKQLKARYGVFSVLGNHDFWEDAELIQQGLTDCGFRICDNRSFWISEGQDSIKIGGVGDLWEDKQLLEKTTHDVKPSDFCILLSHNPDYIEHLSLGDNIDLMLSGHNHGGQVTLFGLYAPVMPSYWRPNLPETGQTYRAGWVEKDDTQLYVTTGVGMGDFPFRFFAPPEIVEIILKKE